VSAPPLQFRQGSLQVNVQALLAQPGVVFGFAWHAV
jgi:hypothetical protein